MLRHLLPDRTDRLPGPGVRDRRGGLRAPLVGVLAHDDRHPVADALGRALWAIALAVAALALVLAAALALVALLAALPAHPALLVAGVAAGYALAWSLPLAACAVVRRLLG